MLLCPADCHVHVHCDRVPLGSDFPAKETAGKETSACLGGGQKVAENGGNERAVPADFQLSPNHWSNS